MEIVACGHCIASFRTDRSPVREKLGYMRSISSVIAFTICVNTTAAIERREDHIMPLVEETRVVPFLPSCDLLNCEKPAGPVFALKRTLIALYYVPITVPLFKHRLER